MQLVYSHKKTLWKIIIGGKSRFSRTMFLCFLKIKDEELINSIYIIIGKYNPFETESISIVKFLFLK